jgi:hypothetical protein
MPGIRSREDSVSIAATTVAVSAKVVGAAVDVVIPDDDDKDEGSMALL